MVTGGMPEEIKTFIFDHIDSVEQLDVLLLLHASPERKWTSQEVCDVLRTNVNSVAHRLATLKSIGLLVATKSSPPAYRYRPRDPGQARIIDLLAEEYQIRRYSIYEMIFSKPVTKMLNFRDAFIVKKDQEDG